MKNNLEKILRFLGTALVVGFGAYILYFGFRMVFFMIGQFFK